MHKVYVCFVKHFAVQPMNIMFINSSVKNPIWHKMMLSLRREDIEALMLILLQLLYIKMHILLYEGAPT